MIILRLAPRQVMSTGLAPVSVSSMLRGEERRLA